MPTPSQIEYQRLRAGLLQELRPESILEEVFATEIVQASWRLRQLDQLFHANPAEQNEADIEKHDRSRARANNALRRCAAELRRLQTERRLRQELAKDLAGDKTQPADLSSLPPLADTDRIQAGRLLNRRLQGLHQFESVLRQADRKVAEDLKNLQNTNQSQTHSAVSREV
jgi:hypothetical protein